MENRNSFGILSSIFGLVFILISLDPIFGMKSTLQNKEKYKIIVNKGVNVALNSSQHALASFEKELNQELTPQVRRWYEQKRVEYILKIKEFKRYLEPSLLEEHINKYISFRSKSQIYDITRLIFGTVILIISIGIFFNASWLRGIIYISIPFSMIVCILAYYETSYIAPLMLPSFCWGTWLPYISIVGILVIYNFCLYRFFTHPKVKEQFK
jgi:hypothetical protein